MAIINYNNELVDVYVAFHVKRGCKSFNPYITTLKECFKDSDFLINTDKNNVVLPDEKWELRTEGGIVLLRGRDSIESETGIIEHDGEYDTDIVRNIEDCDEEELELIFKEYCKDVISLSDDIKDYVVCEHLGYKRIVGINFHKTNADIFFSDHTSLAYEWDGEEDVEEDDIREWLQEHNIDPVSIDKYAYDFTTHFYNN